MGRLYGSELIRDNEKEIGNTEVIINQYDPLLEGLGKVFFARQNHNDSITLPIEFTLLTYSDKCKVQIMKHNDKPFYTTQFHAEILNEILIKNYLNIVKNFNNSTTPSSPQQKTVQ